MRWRRRTKTKWLPTRHAFVTPVFHARLTRGHCSLSGRRRFRLSGKMHHANVTPPRIVAVERMGEGVFVELDDGKSALFSASFFYTSLRLADAVNVPDRDGEVGNGKWINPWKLRRISVHFPCFMASQFTTTSSSKPERCGTTNLF